ncbi:unnamed protein product, partial [Heterosigma akashiwo]
MPPSEMQRKASRLMIITSAGAIFFATFYAVFQMPATDQPLTPNHLSVKNYTRELTPISLQHDGSDLRLKVHLCPLDWAARAENPPALPMFRDLVAFSGCGGGGGSDKGPEPSGTVVWDLE